MPTTAAAAKAVARFTPSHGNRVRMDLCHGVSARSSPAIACLYLLLYQLLFHSHRLCRRCRDARLGVQLTDRNDDHCDLARRSGRDDDNGASPADQCPLGGCLSPISRGDGKHGNTIFLRVRRMDV